MSSEIPLNKFIQPSDLGLKEQSVNQDQSTSDTTTSDLDDGVELIKLWEGLELEAYPDPATKGPPITIGYGCTRYDNGSAIKLGDKITKAEAESMLIKQLLRDFLPSLQKIPYWREMSPNQKGAILSYAWNMGAGFVGDTDNFGTINRELSNKKWSAVPDALMLYVKGGGRVMLGLKRRRYAEALLWKGEAPSEAYKQAQTIVA